MLAAEENRLFDIGKITRPHGLKGDVKVIPTTDFPERFANMTSVIIETPTGRRARYTVEKVQYQRGFVIMHFEGVNDVDAAEKLRNALLLVTQDELVPLPAGHYYLFELIGLDVVTQEGNRLGKLTDIFRTGANDVYVVKPDENDRHDYLLPAIKDVVKEIDVSGGKIVVDLLPGLIDED